jgi:hypothetical protein
VNDRSGRAANERTSGETAVSHPGGRRRFGLVAGAAGIAATASLVTLAMVGSPAGTPVAGHLAAAVAGTATAGGGGKGGPTPTPAPGKGNPTPTPTGKGKGRTTGGAPVVTTLAGAQRVAGFRVRTLDGLPGAQLERVTVGTTVFDTAPGRPAEPVVTLQYGLGKTRIAITETIDPLAAPVTLRAAGEDVPAGSARFLLLPGTGPVTSAAAKAPDGVSVVVSFFPGADRQTARQVVERLG